jgi:hypothetical protein
LKPIHKPPWDIQVILSFLSEVEYMVFYIRMQPVLLVFLLLLVISPLGAVNVEAGEGKYLHFTFKAFLDPNDTSAVEWAWVTLVEIPRERAYPEEARLVRNAGGTLEGTVFGLVRAAAWRSAHRYTIKTRCHDRPSEHEVSWQDSWSDQVFAGGQINNPYRKRFSDGSGYWVYDQIRFGFTTRPYLREDGSWSDPKNTVNVFLGPVRVEGGPVEDIRGRFHVRSVNYDDPLVHHHRCEKDWVEQYRTAFEHFEHQNLLAQMEDGSNEVFGQLGYGPRDENTIVYEIVRSTSREHPHWRLREM